MIKLKLTGHIHNRPNHKHQSSYTWPQGTPMEEVFNHIRAFDKACVLKRVELIRT